jgi:hypothetical protein
MAEQELNKFATNLSQLLYKQPIYLGTLDALHRVDSIMCRELLERLTVNPDMPQMHFVYMQVEITEALRALNVKPADGVEAYHSFMTDPNNIIHKEPYQTAPETIKYIKLKLGID